MSCRIIIIIININIFLYQIYKKSYNFWEISYKLLIKVYKFKKYSYIINVLWVFLINNYFNLYRIHLNIIIKNN